MDQFLFLNVLKEVAGILNETRKLFLKNKKLMFSVLIIPLLNGLVSLFNTIAIKSEVTTNPEYFFHLMKVVVDFRLLVASSYTFFAFSSIINFVSVLVMVHASAITLKDENITKIKDFLVLSLQSWKGLLVTCFYIGLFNIGYCFLFVIILFSILFLSSSFDFSAAKSRALAIVFAVFESYLATVWDLSMVISILEEPFGIQALRKAAKIVKGMKPKLVFLNLFFGLLSFGLAQMVRLIDLRLSFAVTLTTGLVLLSLIFALRMFEFATYTVIYFQCKKSIQGKDVDSLRDVEYTKLPSTMLIGSPP